VLLVIAFQLAAGPFIVGVVLAGLEKWNTIRRAQKTQEVATRAIEDGDGP